MSKNSNNNIIMMITITIIIIIIIIIIRNTELSGIFSNTVIFYNTIILIFMYVLR